MCMHTYMVGVRSGSGGVLQMPTEARSAIQARAIREAEGYLVHWVEAPRGDENWASR